MRPEKGPCPEPPILDMAFTEGADGPLFEHIRSCPHCSAEWAELERLVDVGKRLPHEPLSEDRREVLRTSIVAEASASVRRAARVKGASIWAAAAAIVAVVTWAVFFHFQSASTDHRTVSESAAGSVTVLPGNGAKFSRLGTPTDEVLRLVEGTVTVEVKRLSKEERFRVVTGDAEVEVRGTLFDVTAASDRLVSVRVIRGRVEVRPADRVPAVLEQGQRWDTGLTAHSSGLKAASSVQPAETDLQKNYPAVEHGVDSSSERKPSAFRLATTQAPARQAADATPLFTKTSTASSKAEAAFAEGWRALTAGDTEAAASSFGVSAAAAGPDPLAEDAVFWRAVSLGRSGKDTRARLVFVEFLTRYPSSVRAGEASAMLGWLLFEAHDLDGAEVRFKAAENDIAASVRASAKAGLDVVTKARGMR